MMLLNISKIILFVCLAGCAAGAFYHSNYTFNDKKYFLMPDLNDFDDYDECMSVYQEEAKYCYVKGVIKPDLESSVYLNIEEFSSRRKQHFRHDRLTRGVCLNSCIKFVNSLDKETADYFYQPYFEEVGTKLTFDFINFSNYAEDQRVYNRIINICVNSKLIKSSNLTAFSSIEYCRGSSAMYQVDGFDIAFVCLLAFLLITVYVSSSFDASLNVSFEEQAEHNNESVDHYKQTPTRLAHRFLVSFSIKRNWYLISAPAKDDQRDLRAISGIRFWTLMGIVYGHVSWFSVEVPVLNPIFIEKNYHLMRSMIVINGGNFVQNFFFISGFLNSISLSSHLNKNNLKKFAFFVRCVVYRYVRFVPMVLFLALFHATWLHKMDEGPYWDKFTIYERQSCRKNLWTNLLLINNYVSGDMKCMIHTWYLAADFQLSVIGTGLLLFSTSFPNKRHILLLGSIIVSFVIACIHFYIHKIEPILMLPPETLRNQLLGNDDYDKYFYNFHSPSHLNSGNYLFGLAIGHFYYRYKLINPKLTHTRTYLYHVLWWMAFFTIFVLCFVGIYFYEYDMELGLMSSLLGAFMKHIYGPIYGAFMIGIIFGYGCVIPKILNNGVNKVLGKLSFGVYIVHPVIANLIIMKNKFPIEVNNSTLIAFTFSVYIISYVFALFLSLCIELPVQVLYNTFTNEVLWKPRKKIEDVEVSEKINHSHEMESKTSKL